MIYLHLILEFFKIGLFSFGGGYATIPFLYHISEVHHWYSIDELTRMVAVASITPGPVGINVATYAGLKSGGILGSALATTSEMLPSLFLVILVSKLLRKFSDNFYVKSIIETLKPISCALFSSFNQLEIEKRPVVLYFNSSCSRSYSDFGLKMILSSTLRLFAKSSLPFSITGEEKLAPSTITIFLKRFPFSLL